MTKTNKKIFSAFALILVITIIVFTFSKRGHLYKVTLFKSEQGWGYDISKNKSIYIHQPFIPAIEGQNPFKDRKSARQTGHLVVHKLEARKSPTVTREELKSIIGK